VSSSSHPPVAEGYAWGFRLRVVSGLLSPGKGKVRSNGSPRSYKEVLTTAALGAGP
jgi:hypothetical protein